MIKKKLAPIGIFLLLLLGMLLFPYVPIILFNIPYENYSIGMKMLFKS